MFQQAGCNARSELCTSLSGVSLDNPDGSRVDLVGVLATLSAMGAIRSPKPVNLICGLISNDPDLMARAIRMMKEHVGPTDEVSELCPFDMTDYYTAEMGEDLQRQFVSFEKLIQPDEIVYLKTLTNQLETCIVHDLGLPEDRRLVNLDPGYITLSKLVLATSKDFSHRVYLRDGIYAEATLRYTSGQWMPCPWTFPDYADDRYHAFFHRIRQRYKTKLAELRTPQELKP
jgi:hypothetical protein